MRRTLPMNLASLLHKSDKRVLFVGPLPQPVTGQSLACQVLLDDLVQYFPVDVVNLSKSSFRSGLDSVGRVLEVVGIAYSVWKKRNAEVIYFTISESYAGNAKDLLIYLLCFPNLRRMVIHLHGGAGMKRILLESNVVWRKLNEFFLKRLGSVVVLGPSLATMFSRCVEPQRLHQVPNFAQRELFTTPGEVDHKFEDTHIIRVLFLSNLLPGKGHLELLDAINALDPSLRHRFQFDIAGGFESKEQEDAYVDAIKSYPQVRFHGIVGGQDKQRLFAQAHVFCLPTYYAYEGQPISILEAYASGCAVVTTNHSGIPDVFSDGVNGFLVEKRSAASLADALQRVAADTAALKAFGHVNRETAESLYTTEIYTARLRHLLQETAR